MKYVAAILLKLWQCMCQKTEVSIGISMYNVYTPGNSNVNCHCMQWASIDSTCAAREREHWIHVVWRRKLGLLHAGPGPSTSQLKSCLMISGRAGEIQPDPPQADLHSQCCPLQWESPQSPGESRTSGQGWVAIKSFSPSHNGCVFLTMTIHRQHWNCVEMWPFSS